MNDVLDLERYPLDRPDSAQYAALVASSKSDMSAHGFFNLEGFVLPAAIERAASEVRSRSDLAYTHQREHNVYFQDTVAGLPSDHPALRRFNTIHHSLCDDQLVGTIVHAIYEWEPIVAFLARVLDRSLFLMGDALARVNVMRYGPGEALNWHFDRSWFTTTLLIQAAEGGGEFEYRSNLRSDVDPNYDGVARLLRDGDPKIRVNALAAGTLTIFAGKHTLHRVSPVRGRLDRIVAVYSYYERPNVMFSDEERIGFYGRAR
jgi:hypothetical protein